MFERRELTLTVSPTEARDADELRNELRNFEDRVALVHKVAKDLIKTVFIGVCSYVVLDTFRKVRVARNTKNW